MEAGPFRLEAREPGPRCFSFSRFNEVPSMQFDYKRIHSGDVSVLAAEGQARKRGWNEGSAATITP